MPLLWVIHPRKMVAPRLRVVIDMNGIFTHREYSVRKLRDGEQRVGSYAVSLRPGGIEFAKWLADRFDVVVWSTLQMKNLEQLIAIVFGDSAERVEVRSQADCTVVANPLKSHVPFFLKILGEGDRADVMIDDSPYKIYYNDGVKKLYPRTWDPSWGYAESLCSLDELKTLIEAVDIGINDVSGSLKYFKAPEDCSNLVALMSLCE